MAKSLSSLWLKSVRRLGKAQQAQGRKLFKSLLTQATRKAPVRRAKPAKAVKALRTVKAVKPAPTLKAFFPKKTQPTRKPAAAPVRRELVLPGVWRKSYFSFVGSGAVSARRLLYWLYLPASASGASDQAHAALPLVVMLHGCQQTAVDFATSTRMNQLAERKGFAVLYPQQSEAADSRRCWHWYKRATQQGQGEVKLIAQLIAQVQREHGLDASRTYVAGLSAGAALATIVALRHPELVAAVGLHSAPVFGTSHSPISAYRAMQQGSALSHHKIAREFVKAEPQFPGMPVILIHGQRDAVVRRINAEQLAQQFAIFNEACITRPEPVRRNHPARLGGRSPQHASQTTTYYAGRKPQLVRCEIGTLGHAWSGGDSGVPFSVREGPNATLMMWDFFARHRRRPAGSKS